MDIEEKILEEIYKTAEDMKKAIGEYLLWTEIQDIETGKIIPV